MREGSQGVGHPYLTALLLLAIIGGFFVSGGNNLSTIKPVPNSGVVTIIPEVNVETKSNLQLYTFGHEIAETIQGSPVPGASGSGVPNPADPDPQDPNQPLPDCPSHGIKTATCQCPTREEVWAYCPVTAQAGPATCEAPGTIDNIPVPGKNPPNQKYCRYTQDLDSPIYLQKRNDPTCTLACVN